jgi:putative methyltransferase (TIGR04325 family)
MDPFPVDLVHLGSSIQYVDDWKGLLRTLTAFMPRFVLLSDGHAGEVDTFVTAQLMFESVVPYRFLSARALEQTMIDLGYELTIRLQYRCTILGETRPLPTDEFPEGKRLVHPSHFVFVRKGGTG